MVAYALINRHNPTLKVGTKAPIEDSIKLQHGSQSFARLLKKVTVINFWASWCPPCRVELPILRELSQKYAQVAFIGATVSSPESLPELKTSLSIPYTIGHVKEEVSNRWQAQFLPTTYILNNRGQILWAKAGAISAGELEAAINDALRGHF